MKALILNENNPEKIEIVNLPQPKVGQGQVMIKTIAVSLNRRDEWIRQGKYPNIRTGCVLGSDAVGIVFQTADTKNAHWLDKQVIINPNLNWGDDPLVQSHEYSILGTPENGCFAEYFITTPDRLFAAPTHLEPSESAALPLAGLTAYRIVRKKANINTGDKVLITGIGGGVAQFILQFCLVLGARVYVTSGSDLKIDKAVNLGAVAGYNYHETAWHQQAKADSGGFHWVIDSVGGDQVNNFLKILIPGGGMVIYGASAGLPDKMDLFRIFWGQHKILGSTMGNDEEFDEMMHFVSDYKIHPIIDRVIPFDNIYEGFNAMKSHLQFGKIVITLDDD